MFEYFGFFDLILFSIIFLIAIASWIVRKRNSDLSPLQREFKNLAFILSIVFVIGFFLVLRTPSIYVYPDSVSGKIQTLEQAADVIQDMHNDMRDLSRDLEKFKQTFTWLLISLIGFFPALYRFGRRLLESVSSLEEKAPILEFRKPILGLNDE
jgi:amino acid transporter